MTPFCLWSFCRSVTSFQRPSNGVFLAPILSVPQIVLCFLGLRMRDSEPLVSLIIMPIEANLRIMDHVSHLSAVNRLIKLYFAILYSRSSSFLSSRNFTSSIFYFLIKSSRRLQFLSSCSRPFLVRQHLTLHPISYA